MEISDNGKDVFMPMLSVNVPIFNGKYKQDEKSAVFELQSVQESFTNKQNEIFSQTEKVIAEINDQIETAATFLELVEKAESVLSVLVTEYSAGETGFNSILLVKNDILKYKLMYEKSLKNYHTGLAEIDKLTNGE